MPHRQLQEDRLTGATAALFHPVSRRMRSHSGTGVQLRVFVAVAVVVVVVVVVAVVVTVRTYLRTAAHRSKNTYLRTAAHISKDTYVRTAAHSMAGSCWFCHATCCVNMRRAGLAGRAKERNNPSDGVNHPTTAPNRTSCMIQPKAYMIQQMCSAER